FAGNAVDVRCSVTRKTKRIGTSVGLADVVAENNQNVRSLPGWCGRLRRLCWSLLRLSRPDRGFRSDCDAAARVVPPSRTFRRLRVQSLGFFVAIVLLVGARNRTKANKATNLG